MLAHFLFTGSVNISYCHVDFLHKFDCHGVAIIRLQLWSKIDFSA